MKYQNCAKKSDRRCYCCCYTSSRAALELFYSLFGRNQQAFRDDLLESSWTIEPLECFQFAPQPSAAESDLASVQIIEEI